MALFPIFPIRFPTRILQKLGFELWGEVDHPEDGLVWEWRRRT
jgi:hypothetical protein